MRRQRETERYLWWAVFLLTLILGVLVFQTATGRAHPGAWESHSTLRRGGPPAAHSFAGCERRERVHPQAFRVHRCKHKVHWNHEYRALSDTARRTLYARRHCEADGRSPDHDLATGYTYHSEYQYDRGTWRAAGFGFDPHAVYYRELDVRTWRFAQRAGYDPWPRCP